MCFWDRLSKRFATWELAGYDMEKKKRKVVLIRVRALAHSRHTKTQDLLNYSRLYSPFFTPAWVGPPRRCARTDPRRSTFSKNIIKN